MCGLVSFILYMYIMREQQPLAIFKHQQQQQKNSTHTKNQIIFHSKNPFHKLIVLFAIVEFRHITIADLIISTTTTKVAMEMSQMHAFKNDAEKYGQTNVNPNGKKENKLK